MEQTGKPTSQEGVKYTFLVKDIVSNNSKNLIGRRTTKGKVDAFLQGKFDATGFKIDPDGKKKTKMTIKNFKGLKENNIGLVKIPGVEVKFAI